MSILCRPAYVVTIILLALFTITTISYYCSLNNKEEPCNKPVIDYNSCQYKLSGCGCQQAGGNVLVNSDSTNLTGQCGYTADDIAFFKISVESVGDISCTLTSLPSGFPTNSEWLLDLTTGLMYERTNCPRKSTLDNNTICFNTQAYQYCTV